MRIKIFDRTKAEERSSGDDFHWQPRRTQEPDRRGPLPRAVTMSFSLTTSHVAAPTLRLRAGGSDRVRARCGTRTVTQITSSPDGACQRPAALARLEPHAALSTRRGAPPRGLGPAPLVPCAPGFPCARPHRRRRVERCAKCDAFFQRIGLVPEGQTLRDCCKRAMGYTDDGWSRRQVAVGAATDSAAGTPLVCADSAQVTHAAAIHADATTGSRV